MSLKDIWKDKKDNVDDVLAEDINLVAHSAINSEEKLKDTPKAVGIVTEYGGEIFNDYEHNHAISNFSHAEGKETTAVAVASHAEGYFTNASGVAQHVQGKFNLPIPDVAHIVGGGSIEMPKNIHTLDWNGTAWFAGEIKIGGAGQDDPEAQTLATKKDIDKIVSEISSVLDELHSYAENLISGGAE